MRAPRGSWRGSRESRSRANVVSSPSAGRPRARRQAALPSRRVPCPHQGATSPRRTSPLPPPFTVDAGAEPQPGAHCRSRTRPSRPRRPRGPRGPVPHGSRALHANLARAASTRERPDHESPPPGRCSSAIRRCLSHGRRVVVAISGRSVDRILVLLAARRPQRVGDLAADLRVNASVATRHCDRLQRVGLSRRQPDGNDRRAEQRLLRLGKPKHGRRSVGGPGHSCWFIRAPAGSRRPG